MPCPFRFVLLAAVLAMASPAGAQTTGQPQVPSVITQGSGDVTVGGVPAARAGDTTADGGTVVEGSPDVFINGKPAAIGGSGTGCGGIVIGGASNVFVNGKPLARSGDAASGCPQ